MQRWVRGMIVGISWGLGVVSAGCDDGGAGSEIPSSVPRDKRLSDLTPAERTQFCADVVAWAMSGPLLTEACNVDAWTATYLESTVATTATDASLQSLCAAAYSACVANGVTNMCDTAKLATCTATVSEYDACLSDTVGALGVLPPCSAVTRGALASNIARLTNQPGTPACTALQSKCP